MTSGPYDPHSDDDRTGPSRPQGAGEQPPQEPGQEPGGPEQTPSTPSPRPSEEATRDLPAASEPTGPIHPQQGREHPGQTGGQEPEAQHGSPYSAQYGSDYGESYGESYAAAPGAAYGAPSGADSGDPRPTAQPVPPQDPYGYGQRPAESSFAASQAAVPPSGGPDGRGSRRPVTVGLGALAAGVVVASLLGGGVGAGTVALLSDQPTVQTSGGTGEGVTINNPESATAVTAAAAKASPSVTTLQVSAGGQGGSGSGIILDDEGHILTNTHVVTLGGAASDPQISVRLNDGSTRSAQVVGTDPVSDLAVIKVDDPSGLQPAELGSSGDLNVGDQAVAIGAPLGLSGTVTDGIISAKERTISVASSAAPEEGEADAPEQQEQQEGEGFEFYFPDMEEQAPQSQIHLNVLQTDAAINHGNSGGALVDDEGRIIGVNVAIASGGGGSTTSQDSGNIGVGFAIPVDYAQRVAEELIADGEVSHGLLGVTVGPSQDPSQQQTATAGATVQEVASDSPAAEAELQSGDVITGVDDRSIADSTDLTATIREYSAGSDVTITYRRDGEEQQADVTLESM
ncbi:trypsin-like peptidase domain-containing protein [Nesterenkonia sp. F]|uniref:trypsin-like peptidase domain-containing protein n=1 Tax=Nesterenkonia sp. F TaxID=795955 RepID=UPI000255C832|nr:trypsin-like peptidase domain-containing protein [Nesterenkonia sp. F]